MRPRVASTIRSSVTAALTIWRSLSAYTLVHIVNYGVHMQAAAGRMLYNTAEMEKGNAGDADTVAILEGTQLCCTRQLRDLLHCLGGITVLLPLFAQLGLRHLLVVSYQHSHRLPHSFCGCLQPSCFYLEWCLMMTDGLLQRFAFLPWL